MSQSSKTFRDLSRSSSLPNLDGKHGLITAVGFASGIPFIIGQVTSTISRPTRVRSATLTVCIGSRRPRQRAPIVSTCPGPKMKTSSNKMHEHQLLCTFSQAWDAPVIHSKCPKAFSKDLLSNILGTEILPNYAIVPDAASRDCL